MESLESLTEEKITAKSLREELAESIHQYPTNLRKYAIQMAPAAVIAGTGSALSQWAAQKLGYDSPTAATVAGYLGGYIPGYIYFFGAEFKKNREKYQRIFSREFGKFVGTFLAADYVSDLTTFTPAFIATNVALTENTSLHPVVRGLTAWAAGSVPYILAISGIHPLTRKINEGINKCVKKIYNKIKKK